jgi:hypothetical protein
MGAISEPGDVFDGVRQRFDTLDGVFAHVADSERFFTDISVSVREHHIVFFGHRLDGFGDVDPLCVLDASDGL